MNPILRKIGPSIEHSFSIRHDNQSHLYTFWHYHPEIELTLIRRGNGTRFVGDHVERFQDGDLVFLGSGVPHLWRNDSDYFKPDSGLTIEGITIQFQADFWGPGFLQLPEMAAVRLLFDRALRGLKFHGSTYHDVVDDVGAILSARGVARIEILIRILRRMAHSDEYTLLASAGGIDHDQLRMDRADRLNQIFAYTIQYFNEPISIDDVSAAVNLSKHSFCQYFKKHTFKTYWRFLTEVRIGHACKLLLSGDKSVSEIAFLSGYGTLSNFNRQFKLVTNLTPLQYVHAHRNRIHV